MLDDRMGALERQNTELRRHLDTRRPEIEKGAR
jgi:hypothetical protein